MGAKIDQEEAMCYINGPTPLHGARVYATDLRCGAALIVAALMADGVNLKLEMFIILIAAMKILIIS